MWGYFVGAAVCALVAGWMVWSAQSARRRHARLVTTETSSTGLLRELVGAAAQAAGPGSFSQLVEVAGTAQPGPHGLLTSEVSKTRCVWHKHTVTRKYRDVTVDSKGRRQTRTREEVLTASQTSDPFLLRDADGEITIVPTTNVSSARKSVSEFREAKKREGSRIKIGGFELTLPTSSDGETLGYEYEEWVLLPGARIFVQGEASDGDGELAVRDPRGREKMVISTRSEEELLDEAAGQRTRYLVIAAVAAVLAVVLVVLGVTLGR